MSPHRLSYLLPWVKVNLLICSITGRIWPEDQWRIIKPQLRRALEIRIKLARETWCWN